LNKDIELTDWEYLKTLLDPTLMKYTWYFPGTARRGKATKEAELLLP
jgi:hypothetical protein